MAPIGSRDGSQTVTPLVAGYIARQLQRGVYKDMPFITPLTGPQLATVRQLAGDLLAVEAGVQRLVERKPRRPQPSMESTIKSVMNRYSAGLETVLEGLSVDDVRATLAPIQAFKDKILAAGPPFTPFGDEDATALAAAQWFKHEFFRWADPIKCVKCNGETSCTGVTLESVPVPPVSGWPSSETIRVEQWSCKDNACGGVTRFPRHGSIRALLETRSGRCGEFANLFYAVLRVLGLDTRYVWNSEDHVWTEYWSPTLGHWVHVDSCEAETNKPLLYARGWGKAQAYCLAFGPRGAEDVTRAYVDDWDACLGRRRVMMNDGTGLPSSKLEEILLALTVRVRAARGEEDRIIMQSMDEAQARWLADEKGRWREAELVNLHGRDSGTEEWRKERGEFGDGGGDES